MNYPNDTNKSKDKLIDTISIESIDNINRTVNATEILPGLWLGNAKSSLDKRFLKQKKITCIINCTESLPFIIDKNIILKYRVAVKDNLQNAEINKLYSLLNSTVNKIYTVIVGHNILLHCHAGRQRSVTVMAAYLMKFGNLKKKEAISAIRSKRAISGYPQLNF